jgi:single-stranded-DNA-specific exonuclease
MEAASSRGDSSKSDRRHRKSKITSGYIGYTIAPRINAAGRVKSAGMAVELFLASDYKRAAEIADGLCKANKERQAEENKIMQEAYKKIEQIDLENNPVIVLDADNWHHGVIGIVASRITEKYCRPSILVSFEGNTGDESSPDDVGKGSGRSVKGINLVDALVYCSDHLLKYGGHELAAGLSVKRGELDSFRKKINDYAKVALETADLTPVFECDCEISFSDANLVLAEQLQKLEPYGVGNPVPAFVMRGVTVSEIAGVSDGKHTRFTFSDGRSFVSAMYFSNSPASTGIFVGDTVDILFNVDINDWMGRKSLQIIIRDISVSYSQKTACELEERRFEEIKGGAEFTPEEGVLPTRDDFAAVYTYMLNSYRSGVDVFKHRELCTRLSYGKFGTGIGYVKLKFIIMILRELNIITIDEPEHEVYKISIHYSTSKTDLEKSSLLRKLRAQQRHKI